MKSYSEDKYDPDVNPTVTSSFITAAFRFGHSLLPNVVERWSSTHKFIGWRDDTPTNPAVATPLLFLLSCLEADFTNNL
uniref:Thyroid peroxidase n=1 Tax=Timema poppense TaxID=170557 RepID=A0A7R9DPJ5_TIMPO|nr:unnamed protein product [Timema poppensis]